MNNIIQNVNNERLSNALSSLDRISNSIKEEKKIEYSVKQCPFYHEGDGQQLPEVVEAGSTGKFFVQCSHCCAAGPFGNSVKEAIDNWNNRYVIVLSEEMYKMACEKAGVNGEG